jgi:hypothetical protein
MCIRLSPELEIMRAPGRAYSRIAAERYNITGVAACYRPVVVAVTIGTATTISSTSHVSIGLVASVTACWAFLVAIQVIAGWVAMPSASRRELGPARALDRLFAGHAPWSLWLLAAAGWSLAIPTSHRDTRWLMASMCVPLVWNAAIVFAFFRNALGLPHDAAVRRTIAHQALTVGSGLAIFGSAVAIWPRIVGILAR